MLGFQQRILQTDIEIVEVHVVKEHVDATEVVGGGVHLLTEVFQIGILSANGLGKLQQQRTRATGWVVDLLDVRILPGSQTGQEFADLLGREELTAALAGLRGVHLHQKFVGVAKGVVVRIVITGTEIHLGNGLQDLGQELVALDDGRAKCCTIHREVAKQPPQVVLRGCAQRRSLDAAEDVGEALVQVLVPVGSLHHILEELRGQDEIALFLDHLLPDVFGHLVADLRIVEVWLTSLVHQLVDIVADIL